MATSRHSSLPTMLRSRTPLTDEQIMRVAPSVYADQPHESRGERYAYIPTSRVVQGLRNEGFVPMAVGQSRTRIPGKRDFTKHMLRFRHHSAVDQIVGQEVPEIVLLNSHDGTSSYQLMGGIFRLICSNGMISGEVSSEVRVRHSGNILDNVIEGSYEVINDINRLVPVIEDWKKIHLTYDERKAYAESALGLRWDADEAGNVQAPISSTSLLNARRVEDREDNLFVTFNKVQENLIRGGIRGEGSTGKRMTTRAVASVTENVKLNRSLWMLTKAMAEMKAAQ